MRAPVSLPVGVITINRPSVSRSSTASGWAAQTRSNRSGISRRSSGTSSGGRGSKGAPEGTGEVAQRSPPYRQRAGAVAPGASPGQLRAHGGAGCGEQIGNSLRSSLHGSFSASCPC